MTEYHSESFVIDDFILANEIRKSLLSDKEATVGFIPELIHKINQFESNLNREDIKILSSNKTKHVRLRDSRRFLLEIEIKKIHRILTMEMAFKKSFMTLAIVSRQRCYVAYIKSINSSLSNALAMIDMIDLQWDSILQEENEKESDAYKSN